jgi:clan AA aspartic protease (TIGR02281 family)
MWTRYISFLCCLVAACSGAPETNSDDKTLATATAEANSEDSAEAIPRAVPVPASDSTAEIPLEDDSGTFVVPVTINDAIALKFTIDSGAADVSIPSDVASTLVRAGTISSADYIGSQTLVLADGSTIPSPEFRIRSLRVGKLVLHDVVASVTGPNGSLLLGQTFLTRLKHWSIDNDRHVLLITAREEATAPLGTTPPPAAIAWNAPPQAATDVAPPAIAAAAQTAAEKFFAAWSDASDPDGLAMRRFYAGSVNFYGRQMSLEQLMQEKVRFARRWPMRSYSLEPDSLRTTCSQDMRTCTVVGVLDWTASGPADGRTSSGTARFSLSYEGGRIVAEHGRVLSRGSD